MADELAALLARFTVTREQIIAAAAAIPPQRRDEPFLGSWSVRDLVAHLVGWDYTNVEALGDLLAGRLPAFYARYDPDWAGYNAELVATYKRDDWAGLLTAIAASQRAFLDAWSRLEDADLARDHGVRWRGRRVAVCGLLRAARRDEAAHLRQLEAFAAGPFDKLRVSESSACGEPVGPRHPGSWASIG